MAFGLLAVCKNPACRKGFDVFVDDDEYLRFDSLDDAITTKHSFETKGGFLSAHGIVERKPVPKYVMCPHCHVLVEHEELTYFLVDAP